MGHRRAVKRKKKAGAGMAARAPLGLLIAFAAAVLRQAAAESGGLYRPDDYYGAAPERADVDDIPVGSALAVRARSAREGGRRAAQMAAQPRCREDAYLELRSMCERNLDEIMRLYTKSCQRLHQYTACVGKALNRTRCQRLPDLAMRERQRIRSNVNDYNWSCSTSSRQEYAATGNCDGKELINHHMSTGFCRFEQLRQKTLECQREGYSIIRTRDAHAKADICEELKVFKDCAVAALKATHCSKQKNARQYVIGAVRESFQRFGIECTGLWNAAASTHSAAVPGALARTLLVLTLTAALLCGTPP
ncbi:hypothetical protein MTO96_024374 [Rhipicephalus appendiculatus]